MTELAIVMYHYVRPIADSDTPNLRGLELDGFRRQLDFLSSNYTVVTAQHLLRAIREGESLPENACWLTFDDGYRDHYEFVLPELLDRKLQGTFFPPRAAVEDRQLLDVNAIHHILEKCSEPKVLVAAIHKRLLDQGATKNDISAYKERYMRANRFDDADTIYVKRMLQHALPSETREGLLEDLIQKFLKRSSYDLADQLYMTIEELKQMIADGMFVGSHGSVHQWLDQMDPGSQERDIEASIQFLNRLGAGSRDWIMCYPYGAYSDDTLSIIERLGAAAGVNTKVAKADLKKDNPLLLPRFDTNDFPQ